MLKPPVNDDIAQARWLTGLGYDALQKNQYEQARGCFSRACDACPDDQRLRMNLAKVHKQSGHYNQAISELNRVLESTEQRSEIHSELGDLYLLQGQLQPALKHADLAIDDNRNAISGWELKGRVLARMGKNDEAIGCFQRALTIEGDTESNSTQVEHDRIRYELAQSLMELGRLQKATTVLETISVRFPLNRQPEKLASMQSQLFAKMDMADKAAETLALAIQNPEASSRLYVQLSEVQQRAGDWTGAKLTMNQARHKFPEDPRVLRRFAQLNSNRGDVVIR